MSRTLLAVLLSATLALPLTACSDDLPPPTYSGTVADDGVTELVQRTLDRRARALRSRDLTAFRRTLDRQDRRLVADQRAYFDNIAQLPVGVLRYALQEATLTPVEGTGEYWAEVVLALELSGVDAAPVRTRDRFLFRPAPDGTGRMLVASTTDAAWETGHPGNAQPWDLGPIQVRQSTGVVGIFDDTTVASADDVLEAAANGRYEVRTTLGSDRDSALTGVALYVLQDVSFLRGLTGQTIGDPDRADGLTVAVPVDQTSSRGIASYRISLNPRVLGENDSVLGRLVRHELTHATLGERGRGAPLWITEGLAEYVSVQSMAPSRRRLPARALEIADSVDDLPGEEEFAGVDAEAWYAVSWWACEYVASIYGDSYLVLLLDRLAGGADQDEVLDELLGLTSRQVARRGTALMSATYRD